MTSTEFTVGMGDNCRNSSKVLKPPGGGCSDLFGQSEDTEPVNSKDVKDIQDVPSAPAVHEPHTNITSKVERNKSDIFCREPVEESVKSRRRYVAPVESEEKTTKPTSIRVRQPPGGKSSGIF